MTKRTSIKTWLPLSRGAAGAGELPTGAAFRGEWIDFERGIRVGNLEPHERITQILKYHLEQTYRTPFVTDRWGRGVFWQWICWLPRANRLAKPMSNTVNFGCAKFFIMADREQKVFRAGLQIERGSARQDDSGKGWCLQEDWDWHRLMKQCRRGSALDAELHRLLDAEGFVAEIGAWEARARFTKATFRSTAQLRRAARDCPDDEWVGFQLYYPMPAAEVRRCSGYELTQAILGAFRGVAPAMNACMQIELQPQAGPHASAPWDKRPSVKHAAGAS
jgi:hypothetical protein